MKRKVPFARHRRKAAHSKDTDAFGEALRRKILEHSDGLNGRQLAEALFQITDEMWHAGIDDAWEEARMKNRKRAGNIFCITWLTMLASRLEVMQKQRTKAKRKG